MFSRKAKAPSRTPWFLSSSDSTMAGMKSGINCGVFFSSLIAVRIAFFLMNLLELLTHYVEDAVL